MELHDPFSFRDYIAYFFPGLVVIVALCIKQPDIYIWIKDNNLLAVLVILASGYILGTLCQCISFFLLRGLLHRIFGPPWNVLLTRRYTPLWSFSDSQMSSIREVLTRYWGDKFNVSVSDPMLLHLCWRDIQQHNHDHPGLDYIRRCLSFYNYYLAMLPAVLLLLIVLISIGQIIKALVTFVSFVFFCAGYYSFAAQFAGNIYMVFYITHMEILF